MNNRHVAKITIIVMSKMQRRSMGKGWVVCRCVQVWACVRDPLWFCKSIYESVDIGLIFGFDLHAGGQVRGQWHSHVRGV